MGSSQKQKSVRSLTARVRHQAAAAAAARHASRRVVVVIVRSFISTRSLHSTRRRLHRLLALCARFDARRLGGGGRRVKKGGAAQWRNKKARASAEEARCRRCSQCRPSAR